MSSSQITSEDISRPPPGAIAPLSVRFSPDGGLLTYLFPDAGGLRQVYAVDCGAGSEGGYQPFKLVDLSTVLQSQKTLSLQEQLRRERMRLFTTGVSSYEWGGTGSHDHVMMIPIGGEVLLLDPSRKEEPLRSIYDGSAGASVDPHLSPDCRNVAFVINDDLYVQPFSNASTADGSKLIRMTSNGANAGITCGLADFIAQEEMDRYRGFWWSPNSALLAYTETDETHIPEYQILHQGKADPRHSETHRYPFAGQANPRVRLAVAAVPPSSDSDSAVAAVPASFWMDLAGSDPAVIDPADYYLARVGWWPDNSVMAQVQNRRQTLLQLLRLDPFTGQRHVLVEETTEVWINLHDTLHTFSPRYTQLASATSPASFHFLWASERSGFSQLYLYFYDAATGVCTALLGGLPVGGGGEWCVESIDSVDEEKEVVYFSGNFGPATERHLCRASFAAAHYVSGVVSGPGLVQSLTGSRPGWHSCAVSSKAGMVADAYSSRSSQPHTTLLALAGPKTVAAQALTSLKTLISASESNPVSPSASAEALTALAKLLQTPELHTLPSSDWSKEQGQGVMLHCAIYKPSPLVHGPGPYPAIVSVYGGPHVQRVMDHWMVTADLRAQRLAQDGCVVIKCDNRGSSRRGLAFEGAVKGDMGRIEVDDQRTAVQHFASQGLVDPARVGMFGWSYGGYMSAISLCRAPETFCCGVAGAPVTSWDGYDTHYTERYMGLPAENVAGYESSSVMAHVEAMTGRLLLVHGLIDENVHFRHTARLINKLIECRKPYDLILFPCERHSPHKAADRVYLEDRIMAFFEASFAGRGGAAGTGAGAVAVAGAGAGAVGVDGTAGTLGTKKVGAGAGVEPLPSKL